jgi:hypothetical protein
MGHPYEADLETHLDEHAIPFRVRRAQGTGWQARRHQLDAVERWYVHGWSRLDARARGRILLRIADGIEARVAELARLGIPAGSTRITEPNAERLRLYDLPADWRSTQAFARPHDRLPTDKVPWRTLATADTSFWWFIPTLVVTGAGFGLMVAPIGMFTIAEVPVDKFLEAAHAASVAGASRVRLLYDK